jgi:hypothetical protein
MSYSGNRDSLEVAELQHDIDKFVASFVQNTVDPNSRRTIILFPGGMASALKRGNRADTGTSVPPKENFSTVWLTLDTFIDGVDDLQMDGDVDYKSKFVIPRGEIEFCGLSPYENFSQWCADHKFDLYIFGYDWRRRPECSVRFFLDEFLPALAQKIQDAGLPVDLFTDLTLIGHSLGGMTVKLIMQDDSPLAAKIKRGITVGTPFYGYGGQTLRYFEGESEFLLQKKSEIAKVISSLQGGYFLQFLDSDTFDLVGAALHADPNYPLNGYPSMDLLTPGERADPFNPVDTPTLCRYPNYVKTDELPFAKDSYQQVAKDLTNAVASRFFNIRAVQGSGGKDSTETYVSQKWNRVPATFDPDADHVVPITYETGAGDGTIPAWSARLIGLDQNYPNNVVTLRGDLDHISLMESEAVQNQIYNFLELPP